VYLVASPEPVFAAEAAASFGDSRTFPTLRVRPKGETTVDVRPLVAGLDLLDPRHLQLRVRNPAKDNLKVTEILRAIFALSEAQARDLHLVKMQGIPEPD